MPLALDPLHPPCTQGATARGISVNMRKQPGEQAFPPGRKKPPSSGGGAAAIRRE